MMRGPAFDTTSIETFTEWNLDFNRAMQDGTYRGAYAGEGVNPGWIPDLEIKPSCAPPDAPVLNSITDVSDCSENGIQVDFTAGAGAISHDLYQDGILAAAGYVSSAVFIPGDTAGSQLQCARYQRQLRNGFQYGYRCRPE